MVFHDFNLVRADFVQPQNVIQTKQDAATLSGAGDRVGRVPLVSRLAVTAERLGFGARAPSQVVTE